MRVLQVTTIPITALRFVLPLARALADAGHTVELASGPGQGIDALEVSGFPVHRLPISRSLFAPRNLHAVGALRARLRAGDFAAVHAHTPPAAGVARIAADRGTQVVYTMHGSLWGPAVPRLRAGLFTALERVLGRRTDLVFTVNREDAADCVGRARIAPDRVAVLPAGGAGVAPEFFLEPAEVERLRAETRGAHDLGDDAEVIAYVGRTVTAKGMDLLARAFARLAAERERLRLLVLGDALEGDRDAWNAARFGAAVGAAAERILWVGFRDRVAPYMAAADVVVLPSRREGFGVTLAEAAAIGRPVVASRTRGARAAVEPGVTGLLVPVGDADALADALARLLESGRLRARMATAGRRRARDRFTREAVLRAYLEGYRRLREAAA